MRFLAHIIQQFSLTSLEQRERREREEYLAQSADLHELEYRMRQLDRPSPQTASIVGLRAR